MRLFNVIDWVMRLPQELEVDFWTELRQYEEGRRMEYVTSVERIGIEKGRQIGLQEGRQEGRQEGVLRVLLRLIEHRFGSISEGTRQQLHSLSSEELDGLVDVAPPVASLEEFVACLPR